MTARDRKMVLWLRDFMNNELGAVEHQPTIRRLVASRSMLDRWLTADEQRRAKRGDG